MSVQEDMSLGQATNILTLITYEYRYHLEHCRLCLPGKWLCPDAHILLGNMQHWDARVTSLLPPELGREERKL